MVVLAIIPKRKLPDRQEKAVTRLFWDFVLFWLFLLLLLLLLHIYICCMYIHRYVGICVCVRVLVYILVKN